MTQSYFIFTTLHAFFNGFLNGIVFLRNFKNDVFSRASVDNIYVDTKVTLLITFLQGTAASLNQHPTTLNVGGSREKNSSIQRKDKLKKLPT